MLTTATSGPLNNMGFWMADTENAGRPVAINRAIISLIFLLHFIKYSYVILITNEKQDTENYRKNIKVYKNILKCRLCVCSFLFFKCLSVI